MGDINTIKMKIYDSAGPTVKRVELALGVPMTLDYTIVICASPLPINIYNQLFQSAFVKRSNLSYVGEELLDELDLYFTMDSSVYTRT